MLTDLRGELRIFHSHLKDCSDRKEPAENFFRYMAGQFGDSERKSVEPIAVHVEGGSVRSMRRTLTDAVRKEDRIKDIYRRMIVQDMGNPNGILITDESGFQKKGSDSVGVAGQYRRCPGKVENSQIVVFSAYASPRGYALSDKRLFIPEKRFGSDYAAERKKCGVPEESGFGTEPQSAAGMIEELRKENVLPFKYIAADCLYGNSPEFIESPDCYADRIFSVSIQSDTRCRLQTPVMRTEEYRCNSETETWKSVSEEPISVSEWAAGLNGHFRYERRVSEGTGGPVEYEFTEREVTVAENGLPRKSVWLIIKRTVGKERTYSCYISNAPVSTRLKTFVWLSGIRWAIGQCSEETEAESGTDQYAVRKYSGRNHHILTCMSAHFFLRHLKITSEKKAPALTLSQVRILMKTVLPLRNSDIEDITESVKEIHLRNHRAYLSHRKKITGVTSVNDVVGLYSQILSLFLQL